MQSILNKLFGSSNDRVIKKYEKKVKQINNLEEKYSIKTDEEIKSKYKNFKKDILNNEKILDDVLVDIFAMVREMSLRILSLRHHDVQLIGGIVLHEGKISEMKTGEGKTLVATLPVILNALKGEGIHLITVNDYLAKRDATELEPLYSFFDLTVGILTEGDYNAERKREIYSSDIIYGTNNEFGFDYLRDNMSYEEEQIMQKKHSFAIVDEVDSILIDEARTPLIISGPTDKSMTDYNSANKVALNLKITEDFTVDEKDKVILITEAGITHAEKLFKIDNLYSPENAHLSHILDQALQAHYIFEKDKDDIISEDSEIVIVDEFTGRLSEGRRFSEGLHQALEAKEKVEIKEETQTLADITFQNYFRMYDKLSGMTGTASTEATELSQIYNLDVVTIPTNLKVVREDLNDLIYKTELEKFNATIETIQKVSKQGQPILIGTASIEKSEMLHNLLEEENIKHTVLNAKNHEKEGEIIKDAGNLGAITVATNMAGRGVDIKISKEVKDLGGLYIIGTERHENRRIDNQLRGRSGRQGDPGITQFYLSLEDNLLRIFGSVKIKSIMERLGVKDGEYIESKMVTRAVEKAQGKVENMHYEGRKQVVEYDDIANEQRKIVYKFRNNLLNEKYDIKDKVNQIREDYIVHIFNDIGIYEGGSVEDYDFEKLINVLKEELNIDFIATEISNLEYSDLFNKIRNEVRQNYENKINVLEDSVKREMERDIYLKELDNSWREHLYTMDNMKAGIQLRAYNQKDPLTEYKKESFQLFGELIEDIKFNTVKSLHLIQFNINYEAQKIAEQVILNNKEESQVVRRNDICPCGSGRKYKSCCGKQI